MHQTRKRVTRSNQPYAPSPRDIRRECERVQANWSERERRKRAGRAPGSMWMPPRVALSAIDEAIFEDNGNSLPPPGSVANDWDR